ncbi:hypothetical protein J6590_108663 [Homalodisca vitripennis]|nr:hypothetical protein J6590_108663 [Homalodisca vitripennis]
MEAQKKCSMCKEIKGFEAFYKDKSRKDGIIYNCKDCYRKYHKELYDKIEKLTLEEKECLKCKETKKISEFNSHPYSRDKKDSYCKDCVKKNHHRLYYEDTQCECGRTIKWLNNYQKHLQTKYHNSRVFSKIE